MVLFFLLLTPLCAALFSSCVRKNIHIFEFLISGAALIELILVIMSVQEVLQRGTVQFTAYFSLDALGAFVLFITALVGCVVSFHSIGYAREEFKKEIIGFRRVRQYCILFHIFLLAMFAALLAANPISMWIAIEATTLSTTFLISFYNKPSAVEAAWKYLVINSLGLLLGFFGTLLFFTSTPQADSAHLIDWNTLLAHASTLNPFIAKIAFVFVLIGYGTKVGLSPMHTWLPDAHSKAPAPISALLSGTLLNIAFLAILRFKIITDTAIHPSFTQNLLIFFGLLSVVVAVFIIFVQKKYKRLLAYSSIEHMGVIALGFGFGGMGSFAALLHMMYHSFAKSMLFLASGNIFLKYGFSKISNIRGMLAVIPYTAIVFFLGFLALAGAPPFGTFLTEFTILAAGIQHHLIVSCVMLLFFALLFVGFLRHVVSMIFGEPSIPLKKGEANLFSVIPLCLLAVVLIGLSLYLPDPLVTLAHRAALTIH